MLRTTLRPQFFSLRSFGTLLDSGAEITLCENFMSRILIFTPDAAVGNIIASAVADMTGEVVRTSSACGMAQLIDNVPFALVIIASTRALAADSRLDAVVRRLHRCDIPVFVILRQLSEQRATRLFRSGVDQCMTFPINIHRLRRKVHERIVNSTPAES